MLYDVPSYRRIESVRGVLLIGSVTCCYSYGAADPHKIFSEGCSFVGEAHTQLLGAPGRWHMRWYPVERFPDKSGSPEREASGCLGYVVCRWVVFNVGTSVGDALFITFIMRV
jgi:hypothetical protein